MDSTRSHLVALGTAALTALVVSSLVQVFLGDGSAFRLLGWRVMFVAMTYPTAIAMMRSDRTDPCTAILKRLASPRHP